MVPNGMASSRRTGQVDLVGSECQVGPLNMASASPSPRQMHLLRLISAVDLTESVGQKGSLNRVFAEKEGFFIGDACIAGAVEPAEEVGAR